MLRFYELWIQQILGLAAVYHPIQSNYEENSVFLITQGIVGSANEYSFSCHSLKIIIIKIIKVFLRSYTMLIFYEESDESFRTILKAS